MTHTCTSTYATTTNTSPLIGRLGAARCCSAAARHDTSSRPPTVLCVTTAGVSDLTPRETLAAGSSACAEKERNTSRPVWATRLNTLGWIAMYGRRL